MSLVSFGIYLTAVFVLVIFMVGASYLLGERHRERATDDPYESGMRVSASTIQNRVDIRFYLIAVFFVIFDLETVFLFAWAVGAREVGWPGYVVAITFIGVLLATLAYLWREGTLNLATKRQREAREVRFIKL